MKNAFFKLVLLFIFGLFNLHLSAQSDKEALHSLVQEAFTAFEDRDATRFAACYTEDVDFINPFGGVIKGRKAVEEVHNALFKAWANKPKRKGEIGEMTIRFLNPDVAVCQLSNKEVEEEKGKPVEEGTAFLMTAQRVGAKWLIAGLSITPMLPYPGKQKEQN